MCQSWELEGIVTAHSVARHFEGTGKTWKEAKYVQVGSLLDKKNRKEGGWQTGLRPGRCLPPYLHGVRSTSMAFRTDIGEWM